MAKDKKKTENETKEKVTKQTDDASQKKLEAELKRLGKDKVYQESSEDPDDFKDYPIVVVCKSNPQNYIYPIILKLETNNIIRLTAVNNYVATVLRIADLFSWCMDVRLKRKRYVENIKTKKTLIVNEFILEKIPACRG